MLTSQIPGHPSNHLVNVRVVQERKGDTQTSREKSRSWWAPGSNPDVAMVTLSSLGRATEFAESVFSSNNLGPGVPEGKGGHSYKKLPTQADPASTAIPSDAGELAKVIALITFCCCDKNTLPKATHGEFLAYTSRGSLHNGSRGMAAGSWSSELKDHIYHQQQTKQRGTGRENWK